MFNFKKKSYDLIVGLGYNCSTSEYLRGLGYQTFSYPFDWVANESVETKIELILNDFQDFFSKEDLVFTGVDDLNRHDVYKNIKTDIIHPHDFPKGSNFNCYYTDVKEKYNKRISRLYDDINRNNSIAFIIILKESVSFSADDISKYRKKLNDKLNKKIDIIIFNDSEIFSSYIDEDSGVYIYRGPYIRDFGYMGNANLISKEILDKIKYKENINVKLIRFKALILYKVCPLIYFFNREKRHKKKEKIFNKYKYIKYFKYLKMHKKKLKKT